LAVWQTGLYGLRWIDELAKDGHAVNLGGNGYPCRYTAPAEVLLPRIIEGPPEANEHWIIGGEPVTVDKDLWIGKTLIDQAAIADCRSNEWLLVEAWDES
jgi:hypothetical protein